MKSDFFLSILLQHLNTELSDLLMLHLPYFAGLVVEATVLLVCLRVLVLGTFVLL